MTSLLWVVAASAREPREERPPEVFQVAYPAALHVTETVHRERVKSFEDGGQTEVIDQTSDVVVRAVDGGWELVQTLSSGTQTRNGQPAPDLLGEMMRGLPVTVRFDAEGRVVSAGGFEPLAEKVRGLLVSPEIRQMLERALDPGLLAAKAVEEARERFGALAGRPTVIGSAFGLPGPDGATAEWTVSGAVACPPGSCLAVDYHFPLAPGEIALGAGISANLVDGQATGRVAVDPRTGLSWSEVREESRKMTVQLGARTASGTVTDHLERAWTLAQ